MLQNSVSLLNKQSFFHDLSFAQNPFTIVDSGLLNNRER